MDHGTISSLFIYPIKSARGIAVTEAEVTERGFAHDRRFMVVDERGKLLTQRQHPTLALVKTEIQGETLVIEAPGAGRTEMPLRPREGAPRKVQVWSDTCDAIAVAPEATDFFRRHLRVPCELVYMPDETMRQVDPTYAAPGDIVSFADGFAFLVISEASLAELNAHLRKRGAHEVPMNRFRPNLVVTGCGPHAEDTWREITIGEVAFRVAKPCDRCVLTTVDQQTGVPGKEPLATLATYRSQVGGVMFGQNLVHRGRGVIRVGDAVRPAGG